MKVRFSRLLPMILAFTVSVSALSGCGDSAEETETETTSETSAAAEELPADDGRYSNSDWTYGQVDISGGGFVTGIISTSEEGLFYARTDVGGAYRWDNENKKWICLSYDTSVEDVGLLGIDGIACDPKNPAKVYLAAGTEYFSSGKTCIMVSDDYGEHFTQVDVSDKIRVHGNGMGRGNGERIAVDPNNTDIIFCGGRTGGLIKSSDGGMTWEKVDFPVESTSNGNGINGIVFDESTGSDGQATQKIYVSVSRSNDTNVYVSEDGGASFNPISGGYTEYMPQRMRLDSKGRLYVVYANNEGPWNAMKGCIYRYDGNNAEQINFPIPNSLGDIAISPNDDNKLVCVTTEVWDEQPNGAYGDKFYTSTDGGETWKDVSESWTFSSNGMDWISNASIHWCSCLAMDPFNDSKIMVNSGNGIFACDNIWDDTPEFYFNSKGIEETVPLEMVTLPDYPLISAIGDYDGFVHEDIFSAPKRHTEQIGTCTSIAVAAGNKDVWVKTGGDENGQKILYTEDGGETWTYIENKPDPDKNNYKGRVGLNADGSVIFWSPENGAVSYSTSDRGETWNKIEGMSGTSVYFAGDSVNPDYVYACSSSTLFVSSDKGKTFERTAEAIVDYQRLCVVPGKEGAFYLPGGALFYTEDYGKTLTQNETLKACSAVSLGKPKNDGDPYVIYIWGCPKTEDTEGIYMSEDNGQTWSRVNDDYHEFGGMGNGQFICGDLNVYGRCYMSTVGLGIVYCDKIEK